MSVQWVVEKLIVACVADMQSTVSAREFRTQIVLSQVL